MTRVIVNGLIGLGALLSIAVAIAGAQAPDTRPIDLTVAFEVSASVKPDRLDQMRRAVQQLVQDLTPQDRIRLISFNIRVNRLVDFATPRSAVDAALRGLRTFGPSAMRDAMAIALTTAAEPGRRTLLVVIAESDDRSSVTSQDALLEVARHAGTRIALVMPASLPAVAAQREQLYGAIAKDSGGVLEQPDPGKLTTAVRKVLTDFRAGAPALTK